VAEKHPPEETLAAPALPVATATRGGSNGLPFLLISLLVAIGLLALASAPPALGKRPGLAASVLHFRAEIAVGGAMLLLLSAIAFFLTA